MINAQTTFSDGKVGHSCPPVCAPYLQEIAKESNKMKLKGIQSSRISRCLGLDKPISNKLAKLLNGMEVEKNSHIPLIKGIDVSFASMVPHDDLYEYIIDKECLVFQIGISHIFIPIKILTSQIQIIKDNHYQVYTHGFFIDGDRNSSLSYTGMTGRNLWIRFAEHKKANSFFSRSMKDMLDGSLKGFMHHTVVSDGLTRKEALELEGTIIDDCSLYPNGHNIMPGGMEGVEYARRYGLGNYENASDKLSQIVDSPKKLEELCSKVYSWEPLTDEQLTSMVCNNTQCFDSVEIRFIRICSLSTKVISDICLMFKDNFPKYENKSILKRVKQVVTGETYRFVT